MKDFVSEARDNCIQDGAAVGAHGRRGETWRPRASLKDTCEPDMAKSQSQHNSFRRLPPSSPMSPSECHYILSGAWHPAVPSWESSVSSKFHLTVEFSHCVSTHTCVSDRTIGSGGNRWRKKFSVSRKLKDAVMLPFVL